MILHDSTARNALPLSRLLFTFSLLVSSAAFAQVTKDGDSFHLRNGMVTFSISKSDGHVSGGWNAVTGEKYLTRGIDRYVLERKSAAEPAMTDETSDRVVQVVSKSPLTIRCKNGTLPLVITKRYELVENRLVKKVGFESDYSGEPAFLHYISSVTLEGDFAETGFYLGASELTDLVPAKKLESPRSAQTDMASRLFLLTNFGKKFTFSHYRHKVSGQFCLPWDSYWIEKPDSPSYLPPYGWEFGVMVHPLKKGSPFSAEVHYKIQRGGQVRFWEEYRQLPELKAFYRHVVGARPDWVDRVKFVLSADGSGYPFPVGLSKVKQALEYVSEGNILVLSWPMLGWPEYPIEGPVTTVVGGKVQPEVIRKQVEQYHAMSPQVKVAFYTYIFSAFPTATVFKEHPDWFRTEGKSGAQESAYSGLMPNFLTMLSAPGCKDYFLDMYDRLMRYYNLDAIDLDFGGAQNAMIDWKNNRVDQPTDWFDFYCKWRVNTRKIGRDRAVWLQSRSNPLGDCGFMELGTKTIAGDNWRVGANYVYLVKLIQRLDPKRWTCPLYWSTSEDPYFANYLVGLGLKPPPDMFVNFPTGFPALLPYVDAAYEMRHVQLLDMAITPFWQTDLNTTLESYPLRHGSAAFLFLVNHKSENSHETVKADRDELGLPAGREIYVWQFELCNPKTKQGRLTEALQKETYQSTKWGLDLCVKPRFRGARSFGKQIAVEADLPPANLNLIMLTPSPALVYSVNGRRTNFWKPKCLDVQADGQVDLKTKVIRVAVTSQQPAAELLVVLPQGWAAKSGVAGTELKTVQLDGRQFLVLPVKQGQCRLTIPIEKASHPARPSGIELLQDAKPGEAARLRVQTAGKVGRLRVTVSKDGIPCYLDEVPTSSDQVFTLSIPSNIEGGEYVVAASVQNGEPATCKITIPEGGKPVAPKTPAYQQAPAEEKKLTVTEVNREVNGIKVLRTATETWPEYAGCVNVHASAELGDGITLTAGSTDDAVAQGSAYAAAGVEVEGLKELHLKVHNSIATALHLYGYGLLNNGGSYIAGLTLDYHTRRGYTRRVLFFFNDEKNAKGFRLPSYGAARPYDQVLFLKRFASGEESLKLDATRHAPPDWDGKLWVSAVAGGLAPARRLSVRISGVEDPRALPIYGADASTFTRKREIAVPFIEGEVTDALLMSKSASATDFLTTTLCVPAEARTECYLAYSPKGLHLLAVMHTKKSSLETGFSARENRIWRDDCMEILLSPEGVESYYHFIANSAGAKYTGYNEPGKFPGERPLEPGWQTSSEPLVNGAWRLRAFIPFSLLKKSPGQGERWGFNLCRNEAARGQAVPVDEGSTWSPCRGGSYLKPAEFGALIFGTEKSVAQQEVGSGKEVVQREEGLVGRWSFEEGQGMVARDSSGYRNHANLVQAEWAKDTGGGYLRFNGTTSYIECPTNESLSFPFCDYTLSLWMKSEGKLESPAFLIDTKRGGTRAKGYTLFIRYGKVGLMVGDDADTQLSSFSQSRVDDGAWHLIIASVDRKNSRISLWVDGKKDVDQELKVQDDLGSSVPFCIGAVQSATAAFFKGGLDEVRVYDRLLIDGEIAALTR